MTIYSHVAAKAAGATGWHPEGDFWLALALGLVGSGLTAYSVYMQRQTLKAIEKQNNNDVEMGKVVKK
ncbi:hypothetical protein CC86DRAFT_412330 [Ophiobolus disseminans]|uniref:Uncharacterized protein n=1 Tax=Ophiobolus disseminans TaxID=1469910 RepID=A0A6A6ZJG9_9PLEO|nr:hypothetical protein CC86DRAFT_412330 [Ophiobolus disseminans]